MTQETKNLHTPGSKDDDGKTMPGLVLRDFPNALGMVATVATLGSKKYSESGWKEVPFARKRYLDAMMRHQLAIEVGDQYDPETNVLHSAHVAWNALAIAQIDCEREGFYARSFDIDRGGVSTREWDAHPTTQAAWDAAVQRIQRGESTLAKEREKGDKCVYAALKNPQYAKSFMRSYLEDLQERLDSNNARLAELAEEGQQIQSPPNLDTGDISYAAATQYASIMYTFHRLFYKGAPPEMTLMAQVETYLCPTAGPLAWNVTRSVLRRLEGVCRYMTEERATSAYAHMDPVVTGLLGFVNEAMAAAADVRARSEALANNTPEPSSKQEEAKASALEAAEDALLRAELLYHALVRSHGS